MKENKMVFEGLSGVGWDFESDGGDGDVPCLVEEQFKGKGWTRGKAGCWSREKPGCWAGERLDADPEESLDTDPEKSLAAEAAQPPHIGRANGDGLWQILPGKHLIKHVWDCSVRELSLLPSAPQSQLNKRGGKNQVQMLMGCVNCRASSPKYLDCFTEVVCGADFLLRVLSSTSFEVAT